MTSAAIEMHMQPIIDLVTRETVAFESLARLARPGRSLLTAAAFVPGLSDREVDRLFSVALDQSLGALSTWLKSGIEVDVSVNIDPSTLANADCTAWVASALRSHGVPPDRLVLEILETHAITDERQRSSLSSIRGLGVRLAIDDFGSGHSDSDRLASFDFDVLKIDGAVVGALAAAPEQTIRRLVEYVRIAEQSDLATVVEGIETLEMAAVASAVGAQQGQGYAIARPMAIADVPAWIAGREPATSGCVPSFASVLAFHGRHGAGSAHTGTVDECPISAFIAEHAGSDPVGDWHSSQHGAENAGRSDGGRRLSDWLVHGMAAA